MNPSMRPANQSEGDIFDAALACPNPTERAAYLDQACAGQPELRERIEALLAAHQQATGFMENPNARANPNPTVRLELPGDENPGDVIGHYKIREKIGEGGCGVVYVADQEQPVRRRVALKVVKLGMDTKQVVARFEAERQALALMDHPNIAKVFDAGSTSTGRPFFVMELVRGIKITDYCDQNNLSTEDRLKLFMQVCQAVQHAHQKGIIHRDIKPSNVLVTLHDGVPVPKVIDFGIAKATSDQRLTDKTIYTAFEQFLGTPAYMSPEQAEMSGLDIDTRSDIYSLGVLLYELLTGKTPFDPKTLMQAGIDQMRRIIREQEPPRPSTCLSTLAHADLTTVANHRRAETPKLLNAIRGDLDWIVMKCLEKDRTRRYETANGLATEIQRHLSNEPIIARPPSVGYRVQKLVRRNKLAVASTTAIILALVLGIFASSWLAIRASLAKRETAAALVKAQLAQSEETRQRQRAEGEAKRADASANKSQTVLDFVTTIIASGPSGSAKVIGNDTTKIDDQFRDQPDVAASIHRSVGLYYSGVRDWKKARLFLRRSLELQMQVKPELDDLGSLNALERLASVSLSQGLTTESGALCNKLLAIAQAKARGLSPESKEWKAYRILELWAYRKLAQTRVMEGKYSETKFLVEKLLAAVEAKELTKLEAGLSWGIAGEVKLHDGNPTEALKAFEVAKSFYDKGWKIDHAFVSVSQGSAYFALDDLERAEESITNSLPILEVAYGDRIFAVQQGCKILAQIYTKTGRSDEAAKFQKKIIPPIQDGELGDSVRTLLALRLFIDAASLARACLVANEKLRPDSWQSCEARSLVGASLLGQKRYSEAEVLLTPAFDGMKKFIARKEHADAVNPKRAREVLANLIQLFTATGNSERVRFYQGEFDKLTEAEPAPDASAEETRTWIIAPKQ